jgi:perosamine synthetase
MLRVRSAETARLVPGLRHNGHVGFPATREHYWQPAMTNVDQDLPGVWPFNYSLGEAQAALGAKMMDRIDAINDTRARRGERFRAALADFPELVFQRIPAGARSAWHLLPARYDGQAFGRNRDDLIARMAYVHGVKFIVQYYPLYRYPLFQKAGFGGHHCPETDRFFDHMVSIPFHQWMPEGDFQTMIECTREALTFLRKK